MGGEASGVIKTHEVDKVIDKMNSLNEMFEKILKHMDKVIPVHGDAENATSEKDETKDEGNEDGENNEEKERKIKREKGHKEGQKVKKEGQQKITLMSENQ